MSRTSPHIAKSGNRERGQEQQNGQAPVRPITTGNLQTLRSRCTEPCLAPTPQSSFRNFGMHEARATLKHPFVNPNEVVRKYHCTDTGAACKGKALDVRDFRGDRHCDECGTVLKRLGTDPQGSLGQFHPLQCLAVPEEFAWHVINFTTDIRGSEGSAK
eukprot:m.112573 g.112573  ORF g.112573 m.112573 type:complete len:159 (-) comp12974_c0_seq3:488-964(-)